jgi:hypothetical protein
MSDIPSRSPARLRINNSTTLGLLDPLRLNQKIPTIQPPHTPKNSSFDKGSILKSQASPHSPLLDTLSDSGSGKYLSDSDESIFSQFETWNLDDDDIDLDSIDLEICQIDDVLQVVHVHIGSVSSPQLQQRALASRLSYVRI